MAHQNNNKSDKKINVSRSEQGFSVLGGAGLLVYALRRKSALLGALGADLVYRGISRHCHVYDVFDINTAEEAQGIRVEKSVTIAKPQEEVFQFWRNFENLTRFMKHVKSIEKVKNKTYLWTAEIPGGMEQMSWQAIILEERKPEFIRWASLPGSDVENSGSVYFREAPGGRGTEIKVELEYKPPVDFPIKLFSKAFNKITAQQIKEDLRRFKEIMEAGEIATIEGQPSGRQPRPVREVETGPGEEKKRQDMVTEAGEESFPASDPPSWTSGAS